MKASQFLSPKYDAKTDKTSPFPAETRELKGRWKAHFVLAFWSRRSFWLLQNLEFSVHAGRNRTGHLNPAKDPFSGKFLLVENSEAWKRLLGWAVCVGKEEWRQGGVQWVGGWGKIRPGRGVRIASEAFTVSYPPSWAWFLDTGLLRFAREPQGAHRQPPFPDNT